MNLSRAVKRCVLLLRTVRYLRFSQVFWQLRFRLFPSTHVTAAPATVRTRVLVQPRAFLQSSSDGAASEFRFLNVSRRWDGEPDWRAADMPKLWRYNLHYFDYILDERRSWSEVSSLIDTWIRSNPPGTVDAWEPYTASLRIVNWIKYFLQRGGSESIPRGWLQSLWQQSDWLSRNLERHILANHYFKNLKALIFAGAYFDEAAAAGWLELGTRLFDAQMSEQLLADGGHYERSPMYHCICTEDLLDVLNLALAAPSLFPEGFAERVQARSVVALRWLDAMCMPDGEISLFNDSAFGIAPTPAALREYAGRLGVDSSSLPHNASLPQSSSFLRKQESSGNHLQLGCSSHPWDSPQSGWRAISFPTKLSRVRGGDGGVVSSTLQPRGGDENTAITSERDGAGGGVVTLALEASGYYVIGNGADRMIIDCGEVGPTYQPGHAHCDTLSYELALDGKCVVVDTGVHDYEASERRNYSRGTRAHNTVEVDDAEQSEIWGVFRVARRARPVEANLREMPIGVVRFEGAHDGYRRLPGGVTHRRVVEFDGGRWTITDSIEGIGTHTARSFVHLHPTLRARVDEQRVSIVEDDGRVVATLTPSGDCSLTLERCECFPEFGRAEPNDVVVLTRKAAAPFQFGYRVSKS